MKFLFCILSLSLLATGSAKAANATSPNGGSDTCGLGWQVTDKKTFIATTTRATTNFVVPPTFGMTTGTIGCDQHGFAKRDIPAVQYVATHYDSVLLDMARGNGESLQALAKIMGCSDAEMDAFGEVVRSKFSQFSRSENSAAMVRMIREEANICTNVI